MKKTNQHQKQRSKMFFMVSCLSYEGSLTKKYQDHVPCSFAYKVVCIDDRLTEPIVV